MRKLLLLLALLFTAPVWSQTPITQSVPFRNALNAAVAPALNFTGIDAGAVARSRDAKDGDIVSALDFCSTVDGVTDNTACLQAGMDALCARSQAGGTLLLPAKAYAVPASETVTVKCQGVFLQGAGGMADPAHTQGATQINRTGAGSAPLFVWASTTFRIANHYAAGGGVRDLMIVSTNTNSSVTQTGAMLDFEKCEGCVAENVRLWAPYLGIKLYAGYGNRVTQSQINQVVAGGTAILWSGSDAEPGCSSNYATCTGRGDLLQIDHTIMDAANQIASNQHMADCIHVQDFAATTWVSQVACNQFRRGLVADCPTATQIANCPAFLTLVDFESEANDGGLGANDGFNITTLDVAHLVCLGCQLFGYSVVNNVSLQNSRFTGAGDVQFIGGRIGYANNSCIVSSVDQVFIGSGINIQGCGKSGSGYFGLELRSPSVGSGANSGTVQGVDFCRNPGANGTGNASTMGAISINSTAASGTTGYNVITGNRFRGCGSGVTGAGASDVVASNTGL